MQNRARSPRSTGTVRAAAVALLAAALPFLAAGCSAGSDAGVQRILPGVERTALSSSADGVSLSMQARNVDLRIEAASVRLDPSGAAYVDLTIRNLGPAPEHLALVSVPGSGQATLKGGTAASGALTMAGVLLDTGSTTGFGVPPRVAARSGTAAKDPSILLPADPNLKVGGTEPVMLNFAIAGLVHLDLPVRSA